MEQIKVPQFWLAFHASIINKDESEAIRQLSRRQRFAVALKKLGLQ